MLVHLNRRVTGDAEYQRLSAALPIVGFHSFTDTPNTALAVSVDADSRAEAERIAYEIVVAVLSPDEIDRVSGNDDVMQDRQVLFWLLALRHYLDEWERRLATYLRLGFANEEQPGSLIWETEREHHMALNAGNHLLRSLANAENRYRAMPADMADELEVLRHLHEHWDEQWQSFYNAQKPGPLHRSGRVFNKMYPGKSPYWWLGWSSSEGPMVGPGLAAASLRSFIDSLVAEVASSAPNLKRFVTPAPASPWAGAEYGRDRWWPAPPAEAP